MAYAVGALVGEDGLQPTLVDDILGAFQPLACSVLLRMLTWD